MHAGSWKSVIQVQECVGMAHVDEGTACGGRQRACDEGTARVCDEGTARVCDEGTAGTCGHASGHVQKGLGETRMRAMARGLARMHGDGSPTWREVSGTRARRMEVLEGRPACIDEGMGVTDAAKGMSNGTWGGQDMEVVRDMCAQEKGCVGAAGTRG